MIFVICLLQIRMVFLKGAILIVAATLWSLCLSPAGSVGCGSGQWRCGEGLCLEMSQVCDGDLDCNDGGDEVLENCRDSGRPLLGLILFCSLGWSRQHEAICPEACRLWPDHCYYALAAEHGAPNTCILPESPLIGQYNVEDITPRGDEPADFSLVYSCPPGYSLVGENPRCANGNWTSAFPSCLPESCYTPDNQSGDCRSILECPPLRVIVNKPSLSQDEMNLLMRSACGFLGKIPKVCCPTTELTTTELTPVVSTCFTPEGNQGQCMSVFACDHIARRLQSPTVTAEDRAYVNSIRCQGPTPGFNVCCGPPLGPQPVNGMCVPSAAPPDPRTECCGMDATGANKITGGNATSIDQYPWLTIIEYKKDNKIKLLCGGVLISGRYVLTAGHCVKGTVLNVGTPANVRLGEYDTSNPGPDCVPFEGGEPGDVDCTSEPVIIPIERVIPHPEYDPRNALRRHDIAMLRLTQLAPYTDFIRPICLPTRDVTANIPSNGRLFAAGWGVINEKHSSSTVKLHVDLPYKSIETCQLAYNEPKRRVHLWQGQICAGGEKGKDSCKGDSGEPLMYSEGGVFEVVGIVSFGPTPCGLENIPGVYTRVFEYMPWIRSNIQP